jgi:hypothetical protein
MAITTLNLRAFNRSDTASSGQVVTATSATAMDFQAAGGKIGQVLQATFTGTQTIDAATTFTDVTSLSQAITPVATSSKVLIIWSVNVGSSSDAATRLLRTTTAIAVGDAASARGQASTDGSARNNAEAITHTMMWLDSPSTTSATTYKIQAVGGSTTINMSDNDSDSFDYYRTVSTLTLMEILA